MDPSGPASQATLEARSWRNVCRPGDSRSQPVTHPEGEGKQKFRNYILEAKLLDQTGQRPQGAVLGYHLENWAVQPQCMTESPENKAQRSSIVLAHSLCQLGEARVRSFWSNITVNVTLKEFFLGEINTEISTL